MLKYLLVILVGALLGTGAVAANADDAVLLAQTDVQEKKKKDRRVCKKQKVTGSRIKEKVCRKESEWKRINEAARQNVEDARDVSNRNLGSPDA